MKRAKASDLVALLRAKHPAPEWAFLEQVRNATGIAGRRSADAIAMNLYPSRGLSVHGFEVKVSRADWLAEKKNPDKAEAVAAHCDFWWLVVASADIVRPGELPQGWGLMGLVDGRMEALSGASAIGRPDHLPREFIAAVLRQTAQASDGAALTLVADFERRAGVKLTQWTLGNLVEAVRFVRAGNLEGQRRELQRMAWRAERIAKSIDEILRTVPPEAK